MTITERFLGYVAFDTQSDEESSTVPSTAKQMKLAEYLRDELMAEGLEDVEMDAMGYVYATLPATVEGTPTIGFISHYDTAPDCSGANIRPRIVKNYDGKDIELSPGITTTVEKFPELLAHVGEDLIVTDGHTLLGADDKAGIAEIVQAMCYLRDHKEIAHGKVRIAFNPDEEIGMGAKNFDVEKFGCQWAYTMDGGDVGELEYENFNAAQAKIALRGVSVHPGYAKGKMLNASLLAMEFHQGRIADERPETTEGYQGFFHLIAVKGSTERAEMTYIVRDHNRDSFEERKRCIEQAAQRLNDKYGEGTATVDMRDQYYNMREKLEDKMHIVENAIKAMEACDIRPKVQPIRGGTDGAQLSFRGLPCPNLFAGGVNFHGPYEFVPVQSMEKAMRTIVEICKLAAQS